jgi:hypothetical protein
MIALSQRPSPIFQDRVADALPIGPPITNSIADTTNACGSSTVTSSWFER